MAHEIDTSTGRAAVFVTGEPAWHQLGTVIAEAATSAEAIHLAALDWTVTQEPIYRGNGQRIIDRVANARSDTGAVLGVVSTSYQVFQNVECFDFMDALVADRLAMFETAGALKEGRQIWMLARIPRELRAAGSDIIDPYVLLTTGHDGLHALKMIPTSVRVVCNNTLNLALRKAAGKEGFTLLHSKNLQARVEEARRKLGLVIERLDRFEEQIQALAKAPLTEGQARDYWDVLFPTGRLRRRTPTAPVVGTDGAALLDDTVISDGEQERGRLWKRNALIVEQLLENYQSSSNTLPGIRDTAWAAFNAVSQWVDHQSPVRGKDRLTQADHRMHSIFFGRGDELKQQAFRTAMELVAP
jgi:phage/plasmid-like protein (TIGR03299 family)